MNYKKEAIDFLLNANITEKDATLIELAVSHPSFLVKAYKKSQEDNIQKVDLKEIFECKGLIPAIKELRSITGLGLKESKMKIEEMIISEGWVKP